jgi:ABC-type transport system involved in cytochrome c biogenesis permease subunit
VFSRVGAYLKTAFTTRWNLLLFGGGVAAALISGFPGIVLPLVLAGEVYYLASMLANDRFRSAVEAQDAKSRRAAEALGAREAYERIRTQLPGPLLQRFDQLRDHCLKLVELAGSMRGPGAEAPEQGTLESLDRLANRLIWVGFPIFTVALVLGASYVGHQDDLAVFDRALSNADVEHLYQLKDGVTSLR